MIDNTISAKKKKTYSLIKNTKAKAIELAHIEISNDCVSKDQLLVNESLKNVEELKAKSPIKCH